MMKEESYGDLFVPAETMLGLGFVLYAIIEILSKKK